MSCLSPVLVPAKAQGAPIGRKMLVPCGKCIGCLRDRQDAWIYRLQSEFRHSRFGYFVTLTYDEAHVPLILTDSRQIIDYSTYIKRKQISDCEMTINPLDFTLYMKRLRKSINNIPFKFYACMEYGDQFNRPHMHYVCFFNQDPALVQFEIERKWNKGMVTIEPITDSRISYVTKYISKSDLEAPPSDISLPCTQRESHGLGINGFLDDERYHNSVFDLEFVQLNNGSKIPTPRYFRKKFYPDSTFNFSDLVQNEQDREQRQKTAFQRFYQDFKLRTGSTDFEKAWSAYLQDQSAERQRRIYNLTHKRKKGM